MSPSERAAVGIEEISVAQATALAWKVQLTGGALLRLLGVLSRSSDLGTLDLLVLLRAAGPDGAPISEIRRGLAISTSTMTGVVDRLEAAKLVRRERDLRDRRRVALALTRKGRRIRSQMMGPLESSLARGVDSLDHNELAVVDQLLDHVLVALRAHAEDIDATRGERRMAALRHSRTVLAD